MTRRTVLIFMSLAVFLMPLAIVQKALADDFSIVVIPEFDLPSIEEKEDFYELVGTYVNEGCDAYIYWPPVERAEYYEYSVRDLTMDEAFINHEKTISTEGFIDGSNIITDHIYKVWVGAFYAFAEDNMPEAVTYFVAVDPITNNTQWPEGAAFRIGNEENVPNPTLDEESTYFTIGTELETAYPTIGNATEESNDSWDIGDDETGPQLVKPTDPVVTVNTDGSVMTATWYAVDGADHYVYSLRDITDDILLANHEKTNECNISLMLTPGKAYRLAVGAVPSGVDDIANYELCGWGEVEFFIENENPEEVAFFIGNEENIPNPALDEKSADFTIGTELETAYPTIGNTTEEINDSWDIGDDETGPQLAKPVDPVVMVNTDGFVMTATWDVVGGADHYVYSLRDIADDVLLANHERTNECCISLTLTPGKTYCLAVGAVPAGVDDITHYELCGWGEAEFFIENEIPEEAAFQIGNEENVPNPTLDERNADFTIGTELEAAYPTIGNTTEGSNDSWDIGNNEMEPQLVKLADPIVTVNTDGSVMTATWCAVDGADHYVYSLRDIADDDLLANHERTNECSISLMLTPGKTYRLAVGAVPAGVDDIAHYELCGWGEAEFFIENEIPEEAAFQIGNEENVPRSSLDEIDIDPVADFTIGVESAAVETVQEEKPDCSHGKHHYERMEINNPTYINQNDNEHDKISEFVERCINCGDYTELKKEVIRETHDYSYKSGIEKEHQEGLGHATFERCICGAAKYTGYSKYENCCECYGHSWGQEYLENETWMHKCGNCGAVDKADEMEIASADDKERTSSDQLAFTCVISPYNQQNANLADYSLRITIKWKDISAYKYLISVYNTTIDKSLFNLEDVGTRTEAYFFAGNNQEIKIKLFAVLPEETISVEKTIKTSDVSLYFDQGTLQQTREAALAELYDLVDSTLVDTNMYIAVIDRAGEYFRSGIVLKDDVEKISTKLLNKRAFDELLDPDSSYGSSHVSPEESQVGRKIMDDAATVILTDLAGGVIFDDYVKTLDQFFEEFDQTMEVLVDSMQNSGYNIDDADTLEKKVLGGYSPSTQEEILEIVQDVSESVENYTQMLKEAEKGKQIYLNAEDAKKDSFSYRMTEWLSKNIKMKDGQSLDSKKLSDIGKYAGKIIKGITTLQDFESFFIKRWNLDKRRVMAYCESLDDRNLTEELFMAKQLLQLEASDDNTTRVFAITAEFAINQLYGWGATAINIEVDKAVYSNAITGTARLTSVGTNVMLNTNDVVRNTRGMKAMYKNYVFLYENYTHYRDLMEKNPTNPEIREKAMNALELCLEFKISASEYYIESIESARDSLTVDTIRKLAQTWGNDDLGDVDALIDMIQSDIDSSKKILEQVKNSH